MVIWAVHTRAAEQIAEYKTIPQMEKAIAQTKKQMEKAARHLDFIEAARLRDEMFKMQKELEAMKLLKSREEINFLIL